MEPLMFVSHFYDHKHLTFHESTQNLLDYLSKNLGELTPESKAVAGKLLDNNTSGLDFWGIGSKIFQGTAGKTIMVYIAKKA